MIWLGLLTLALAGALTPAAAEQTATAPAGAEPASSVPGIPRVHVDVGLNWFGLETVEGVPGGVTRGLSVERQLHLMRRLGVTALRLPISAWTLNGHPTPEAARAVGYASNTRAGLEEVVRAAGQHGMRVLLTLYNWDPAHTGPTQIGRPFGTPGVAAERCRWCADGSYDKEDWLGDLEQLAGLARRHPHVIGLEITNEPHKLDWPTWKALAEEAGLRIRAIAPDLRIYVPGLFGHTEDRIHWSHWGEWHRGFLTDPIDPQAIPHDQLVLSVHTYSPQFTKPPLDPKSYHLDPLYPRNMPVIWDYFFGEVAAQTGVDMALTEFAFGSTSGRNLFQDPAEIAFADMLFYYLRLRGLEGPHFFWAWNADSEDTLNLLTRDFRHVRQDLVQRLFLDR